MAPPEGSIFDPARKWEEERERRRVKDQVAQAQIDADIAAAKATKKKGKKPTKGKSTADSIKESNQAKKAKKELSFSGFCSHNFTAHLQSISLVIQ